MNLWYTCYEEKPKPPGLLPGGPPSGEGLFSYGRKASSERITADSVLSGKPILGRFFIRVTVDHSLNRLQV